MALKTTWNLVILSESIINKNILYENSRIPGEGFVQEIWDPGA